MSIMVRKDRVKNKETHAGALVTTNKRFLHSKHGKQQNTWKKALSGFKIFFKWV